MIKIALGDDIFESYKRNSNVYIDKSMFIKNLIDSEVKVSLITRPRRFGKTLNMTMLKAYFEKPINSNRDCSSLFHDLKIWKQGEIYQKEQGKYPVIFMSLKRLKKSDWNQCFDGLKNIIGAVFTEHSDLLQFLDEKEKTYYNKITDKIANQDDYESSLKILTLWFEKYYGEKTILLIDEYDTPIHDGYLKNYYDNVMEFMRNMFSEVMKTNPSLKKAVLTGITKIAGESLFSGLNNFKPYNVLEEAYSEYFGFTEKEVIDVLKKCNISHDFNEISKWYNGYTFGNCSAIYNPWSVMNVVERQGRPLVSHWVNTSSNRLLKNQLANKSINVKEDLYKLICGKSVIKPLKDDVTFEDLSKHNDSLWSFLLYSGYLTAKAVDEISPTGKTAIFNIPNLEVSLEFQSMISDWLTEKSGGSEEVDEMLTAMLLGNVDVFEDKLSNFVHNSFSYFDTTDTKPELVYHAFMLGLLVHLQKDYYFSSNPETGIGRADILIMPVLGNYKNTAVILEFKKTKLEADLEKATDTALSQIKTKEYINEAKKRGANKIYCYGVGFYKKQLMIKIEEI